MQDMTFPCAAIVLAAGRSSRFGSNKLLANLRGRPVMQQVLDLASYVQLKPVVVVLPPGPAAFDASLAWRIEIRAINPEPGRGISSSLRVGLAQLAAIEPAVTRTLVVLADQPLLSAAQVQPLLDQRLEEERPIIVPRYSGRPGNPVLLERPAWPLAETLAGDRGMAQIIEARPDLVRYVDLPGSNPDIDTAADLASLG
jgi:CTP:molybdopterin cytidylyltransferase MocA